MTGTVRRTIHLPCFPPHLSFFSFSYFPLPPLLCSARLPEWSPDDGCREFGGLYARASLGSGRVQAAVGWMKSCSGHAPGPGLHVVALPGGHGGRRTDSVDGAVAVVVVALARRFGPGVVLLGCAIAPSFLPLRPPFAFGLNLFVFRMVQCASLRGSHPALCDDSERCGDICTSGFRDVCTAYCTLSQR